MGLVGMWLRLELRRRWRSLVVLTLLVALSGGVVLASVAGARRGESALDRLLARTLPATLAVLPNQPGFDWDAVRALPGVEAVGEFAVTGATADGIDFAHVGFPYGPEVMSTVERPVVLEGRLPDPGRADEAVISPGFGRTYGLGIGDTVTMRLYEPAAVDAAAASPDAPEARGPVIPTRIVGVVRSAWFGDPSGGDGAITSSPALLQQYRANLLGVTEQVSVNALVRLGDGAAGVAAFQSALVELTGRTDIGFFDLTDQAERAGRTTDFESASLLAFGLAALAAAVVLVGQAVVRYAAAAVADLQVLRALGLSRRHALVAAATPPALAGVVGALIAAAAAVAASPVFPFGTAAQFEPAPGADTDALVLGVGGPLLAVLVAAGAAGAARLATAHGPGTAPRRSAVAAAAARAGLPVPVLLGTRFALEPGRGRSALPVRPALVGAVTGVLGVLAALTFSAGVAEAADNPARFGQTHAFTMYLGFNGEGFGVAAVPALEALAADPDVAGTLDARSGVVDAATPAAAGPVTLYTHAPVGPDPYPTVLTEGRLPARPDEIVLAPASATAFGVRVGDTLAATGRGGTTTGTLTVTGIGFVPIGPHNNYDEGGFVTPQGYDRLVEGFKFHFALVALNPGVDPAAVRERLAAAGAAATGSPDPLLLEPTAPLIEAAQLRNVEVLPVVLGGFLALLAVGAVGHALATAVRRRRHDVAVLRALGMTRRQCRAVVGTQATVLAAVGLLFGVPLGLALGRVLWRFVADITPLQYAAPVALLALLLAVPVAVLVANALAAWPGRQAARLRIGHVLRAE